MTKTGSLTLIPSPIDDDHPIEPVAFNLLNEANLVHGDIVLVEDHKVARRRWLKWGLPRESIEHFRLLNEHSSASDVKELALLAAQGAKLLLMSDCGLPAIFDPGQQLVDECLNIGVKVTSSPFPNSVLLALALSGFPCAPHYTLGFLPRSDQERVDLLTRLLKQLSCSIIFMDTPYRYGKVIASLINIHVNSSDFTKDRKIFVGKNLNQTTEACLRVSFGDLAALELNEKPEFVMIIGPKIV